MKGKLMKKIRSSIFAGLLVLMVAAAGLAFLNPSPHSIVAAVLTAGAAFVAGTATVTYLYPVAGATAPTAAQIRLLSLVTVQVHFGDTDTSAVLTHNFGESTAENAFGFPINSWWITAPGTVVPLISLAFTDTNTVTITKASVTGSNCTIEVALLRPHTVMR